MEARRLKLDGGSFEWIVVGEGETHLVRQTLVNLRVCVAGEERGERRGDVASFNIASSCLEVLFNTQKCLPQKKIKKSHALPLGCDVTPPQRQLNT